MFRQNLGTLDRDIRLVLTAVFGLVALFAPFGGLWQIIPAVLAMVMLLTAGLGFCPLYAIFGFNTLDADMKGAAAKK
ncbi:MAG TPA: DUF2892 domain-containing protein [Chloroflexaceae bacterium]|nr:DUF2892 domain-containing protein [Chloroflexaceae bacterium]